MDGFLEFLGIRSAAVLFGGVKQSSAWPSDIMCDICAKQ